MIELIRFLGIFVVGVLGGGSVIGLLINDPVTWYNIALMIGASCWAVIGFAGSVTMMFAGFEEWHWF